MGMWADVNTIARRKLGRTHVIEEHPGTNLSESSPWQQPPDFELPKIDDLGLDDLHCHHQFPRFPSLDRLLMDALRLPIRVPKTNSLTMLEAAPSRVKVFVGVDLETNHRSSLMNWWSSTSQ
jgi:hypothetical protein